MKLPQNPPDLRNLFDGSSSERLFSVIAHAKAEPDGKYYHWDELRWRKPPDGLSVEEWWFSIFMGRSPLLKSFGLLNEQGAPFQFAMTESAQSLAHQIDRDASGAIGAPDAITNKATQRQYLVRSLIEEALTSSQLEGAAATRVQAKQMIRDGRAPRTKDERMVLNNYFAMDFVREHTDQDLSPGFLLELHRIITNRTLDNADQEGRFRTGADDVKVVSHADDTVLHVPPPAGELEQRIRAFCAFANGGGEGFIHPVVRAILLHFWLGYDHPFCDGNGRTARAVFYWSMLRQGYWLSEYVSISRILKRAQAQYTRAFLHSETPPYDVTHFVLHQLRVVRRSINDLYDYLAEKIDEVRSAEELLRDRGDFNSRQLALLGHALRHPGAMYTMESHKRSHRVSHETARQDLYSLVSAGLLIRRKRGRSYEFTAVADLRKPLRLPG